jgi:hypothetical protein
MRSVTTGRKWSAMFLAAFGLLFAVGVASAQSADTFPGDVPNTFRLYAGGMYAWFNTTVTFQENLTPGGPVGAGVNLEDSNLVKSSAPGFVARGYWNAIGRFSVDFGYTGFNRNKTSGFLVDVPFGDSTFTAGASVTTSTKSQLPYLDFRYDFIKDEHTQFGLSLGAAYVLLQAELQASAGVIGPNGPVFGQTVTKTAKESVPVPLLGVKFDQQVGDRLSAGVIFNGIFAPVHPYVGSVFDAEAHLDWFATKNFGLSAAFDYTRFNLKKEQTNTYTQFRYSYYGPRLYVTVSF